MSYKNRKSIKVLLESKKIGIQPFDEKFLGPNLYYCHLGERILIPNKGVLADTKKISDNLYTSANIDDFYDLEPGEFILAQTYETFMTDTSHAIRLFNSSSLARLGIAQCAVGMINPGSGMKLPIPMTLELYNAGPYKVRLYKTQVEPNGEIDWGTEVLKIAVCDYETTDIAYEDWVGNLYGKDQSVIGSRIDKRFKHE